MRQSIQSNVWGNGPVTTDRITRDSPVERRRPCDHTAYQLIVAVNPKSNHVVFFLQ